MKRLLFILFFIPAALFAQYESKYMTGAVPEVNGKVVFTRSLNVQDFNKDQIYNSLLDWAYKQFDGNKSQVVYTDEEKGLIAARGEEEIVVKIGLFPGKVKLSYMLTIQCGNGSCILETSRIKYTNNPGSREDKDIVSAENYITDKYALNKARTKLSAGTGDYRMKTIDLVDKLALSAQEAVYKYNNAVPAGQPQQQTMVPAPVSTPAATVPAVTVTPAIRVENPVTGPTDAQGFQTIAPDKIPGNIIKIVSNNGIHITAVDGKLLGSAVAGEGGLGVINNQPAAFYSVNTNEGNILNLLDKADTYTLTFYNEIYKGGVPSYDPWMIIECKKIQQSNAFIIGEITSVKIK